MKEERENRKAWEEERDRGWVGVAGREKGVCVMQVREGVREGKGGSVTNKP